MGSQSAAALVMVCLVSLCTCIHTFRVAVIGGGVGGTAAAHFLREEHSDWHIELFERDRIGGRAQEVMLDGRALELGASIIHGSNKYMLTLAQQMNLTVSEGDDTGAAFNIWDGRAFVFSQAGQMLADLWAVLKRYGVTPLRYKRWSVDAGRRFGDIYDLQEQGRAFSTPEEWLQLLGLYDATQQSAAEFMSEHLTGGLLSYGGAAFIEELAAAINRINYNQHNEQLNALAGLVSYLPAAAAEVYSIKEGNAELPRRLVKAARLQAVFMGAAVQAITRSSDGLYQLSVEVHTPSQEPSTTEPSSSVTDSALRQSQRHSPQHQEPEQHGPYDAVILATPLEGSGIALHGLSSELQLPTRTYQQTTTSFVTGTLDAAYFDRTSLPDGDIFVTNSARTPFTVVASKGRVNASATPVCAAAPERTADLAVGEDKLDVQNLHHKPHRQPEQHNTRGGQQPQQQHPQATAETLPLWKVFTEEPLSSHALRTLFVNGTVVASKSWAAYPRFNPPEVFAPFELAPGLCYVNALENAASAMEVAAVAAKNCALLVQQHARLKQLLQQQAVAVA